MSTFADLYKKNNDEENKPLLGDPRLRDLNLRRGINPNAPPAPSSNPNFGQS